MSLHVNQLIGFGVGGGSTMPVFNAVSTIVSASSTTVNVNYPSGIVAGQKLLLAVGGDAGVGNTGSYNTVTDWNSVGIIGASGRRFCRLFEKVATGSESGTLAVTCSVSGGTPTLFGQIANYNYSNASTLEATNTAGITSSTTPTPQSITTLGENRLAVAVILYFVNNTCTAITGMTGGTWIESAAEQTASNLSIDWQHALMPVAGTISGGSATIGTTGNWGVFTGAILPS